MQKLLKSSTAQPLVFLMIDSSDGKTGKTGLTVTVTLSKNGGSFASPSGSVSEIANGWYKVAGNATDTGTLGPLVLHATASGADPTDRTYEVVAYDEQAAANLGLTNLDAAISTRSTYAGGDTSGITTLLSRLSATRAGYLDNLSAGAVATASALATLQSAVDNLNNLSALCVIYGPPAMEIPASGSIAYPLTVLVKDAEGHLIDLASSPTITAVNAAGTDRSGNLGSVTHAATGQYTLAYTVSSGAAQEGISIKSAGIASSDSTSRIAYLSAAIVGVDTVTAIAAIKAQTDKFGFTGSGPYYVQSDVADWKGSTAPAMTGDAYAVVNDSSFGNAKLVRSTTPANTLTVDSSHRVAEVALVDTLTTYTNNTPQSANITDLIPARFLMTAGKVWALDGDGNALANNADMQTAIGQTTAENLAAGVLDATAADHDTAGTIGEKINGAGAAGDPWSTELPGSYSAGEAGYILATGLNVTISPLQASTSNPFYAVMDLPPIAQGSAPRTLWTVLDANQDPVDLSAKTVRLVVYSASLPTGACDPFDATLKPLYQYQTGGSGITIGGTDHNQVTVQHDAEKLATPGHYLYWLLNVTDLLPLAWGKLPVRPAVWSV